MDSINIRNAKLEDAPRILEIYAYYVENTVITFEYEVPSLEEFENRMRNIRKNVGKSELTSEKMWYSTTLTSVKM